VRAYNPNCDTSFIFSTWLKGLRFGSELYLSVDSATFFKEYQKIVERILSRPTTKITVACFKEDPEVILAYAVKEGSILHWAFTKPAWREMGLAKLLIDPKTISTVTHLTKIGKSLMPAGVSFDPFKT
jgi:hypothetical protein